MKTKQPTVSNCYAAARGSSLPLASYMLPERVAIPTGRDPLRTQKGRQVFDLTAYLAGEAWLRE
jgi:hypothetical protein